jgi:RNA polymerase sigma factor (sigma-70 family)
VNTVLRYLRKLAAVEDSRSLEDRELLRRFLDERDQAAFAALVERHGPMLLGACRRVLRNQHDAEDVLQATFLVLARRGSAIRRPDSVGSWLYGVAYRLALKLRARQARQKECERRAAETISAAEQMTWADLQPVLDEELQRLPDRYRAPILLCCLEGKSRDEAARELGWAEGAVKIRLERGRELLRNRLARRGLILSAALWVVVTKDTATAALPVRLAAAVVEGSMRYAAGQSLTGTVPASVLAMSDSCLKSLALARVQTWAAALLLVAVGIGATTYATIAVRHAARPDRAAAAVGPASDRTDASPPMLPQTQAPELVPPVDPPTSVTVTGSLRSTQVADTRRVAVQLEGRAAPPQIGRERRPAPGPVTYRLRADARILIDGHEAHFADLLPGMEVSLELSADQKSVVCLRATSIR